MIARIQRASTVEISASADEGPTEVITAYTQELTLRGHEIRDRHCKRCWREFRVYYLIGAYGMTIYSDFPEGEQCAKKQMNIHGGEL